MPRYTCNEEVECAKKRNFLVETLQKCLNRQILLAFINVFFSSTFFVIVNFRYAREP